jgi:hypothetical protein
MLDSDIITSDKIQYKYSCPVIDGSPLHNEKTKGIKITYLLSSRTYSEHYEYNLEEATSKDILRTTHPCHSKPDYYYVFMNDVRRVCTQHQSQNKQLKEQPTEITKERKLDDTKNNTIQDSKYTTPTKKQKVR